MQVTGTGIAVALAVSIALGFIFFGSAFFSPLAPQTEQSLETTTNPMGTVGGEAPAEGTQTTTNEQGLMITDTKVGEGAVAVPGMTVSVSYVGRLENGQVFDASANHGGQPFTFVLGAGQVIAGWEQGIAGMKVGGTRTLVIPAELGYGPRAVGAIPANSTLIFDVELVDAK